MKLNALLVGINAYMPPINPLSGCVNDVQKIEQFLISYCDGNNISIENRKINCLTDDNATKAGIIEAFENTFSKITNDDICVFYFSGHGSEITAPNEIYEPSGKLQTLVCFDSRNQEQAGMDLLDKEISYLIHQATKNNTAHFLALFDSCHSGSVNRDTDNSIVLKMSTPNKNCLLANDIYGFESFTENGNGLRVAPIGSHVAISACRSYESAVEMNLENDERGGLFTNALLAALRKSDLGKIRYNALISRINNHVANKYSLQHPVIDAQGEANIGTPFLQGIFPSNPDFVLQYSQNTCQWFIDKGSIQGLKKNTLIHVQTEQGIQGLTIAELLPNRVIIEPQQWMNTDSTYIISNISSMIEPLKINYDKSVEENIKNTINEHLNNNTDQKEALSFVESEYADYTIEQRNSEENPVPHLVFKRRHSGEELFMPYPTDTFGIRNFMLNLYKIAKFKTVKSINNPNSKIDIHQDLKIEFREEFMNNESRELPIDGTATFHLKGLNIQNDEYPYFSLKITNINQHKTYYVSGLYMDSDYQITDNFLNNNDPLGHNQSINFTSGNQTKVSLEVAEDYLNMGKSHFEHCIKIFVSNQPIDLTDHNQNPIKIDPNGNNMMAAGNRSIEVSDWNTIDIDFNIHCPLPETAITDEETCTKINGLEIQTPIGVSASDVQLSSSNQYQNISKSANYGQDYFLPPLGNGLNMASAHLGNSKSTGDTIDILELKNLEGADNVNGENPIKLMTQSIVQNNETLIAFEYDAENQTYLPVGLSNENGNLEIFHLHQKQSATLTKGLGTSIKIFIKKIWSDFKGIPTAYEHFSLITSTQQNKDVDNIKSAIDRANKVIIFIHGIIGDSKDQTNFVQSSFPNQITQSETCFLTYDYDSLGVSIPENAQRLQTKLEELNITDDKEVIIVAHSMGGLVSRYFIENESGNEIINHLIMCGTPNLGSPYPGLVGIGFSALSYGINFAMPGIAQKAIDIISLLINNRLDKSIKKQIQQNIDAMRPQSVLLNALNNDFNEPNIPYTLMAGDITITGDNRKRSFYKSLKFTLIKRFTNRPLFNNQPSDLIVSQDSVLGIPDMNQQTVLNPIPHNHFEYFDTSNSTLIETIDSVLENCHLQYN